MTDNDWRNARIEEIETLLDDAPITDWVDGGALTDSRQLARDIVAVFEKALGEATATPTEPRFVTDDGLRTWVATPTDDEREALAIVQGAKNAYLDAYPGDDHRERFSALDRLAAGFRRTEVEPSGAIYDAFGTEVTRADTAFELGRQAGRSEPQGEPSDALPLWERPEVIEASRLAYQEAFEADYDAEDCIVAALRAAGEV